MLFRSFLAGGIVAGRHQNGGAPACGRLAVRNVEQRGDVEPRLAFKDNFANFEAVGLGFTEDFCVERRARWQAADERKNLGAHLSLVRFRRGACVDGCDGLGTFGGVFGGDAIEIVVELEASGVDGARCATRGRSGLRESEAARETNGQTGGQGYSYGIENSKSELFHDYALIRLCLGRGQLGPTVGNGEKGT